MHFSEQVNTLQAEVSEWQREVSAAETEISRLSSLHRKSGMQRQHSLARNRGDSCKLLASVFLCGRSNYISV